MKPILRFAPTPSGRLHIGGARTALFNYLYTLKHQGQLLLRIEDTDLNRIEPGAVEAIIEDLNWLGVRFHNGVLSPDGEYREVIVQSKRYPLYQQIAEELIARGRAYRCFCPPERLEELRRRAQATRLPPRYDRHCLSLTAQERDELQQKGTPYVIRLLVGEEVKIHILDLVKGEVEFLGSHLDHPILVRSDGRATALLAGVVDDHHMSITHILRGEEWLSSTPYQYLIFHFMDWEIPQWGHLSLILDAEKHKLSKRKGGSTLAEWRSEGILPQALRRYLVSLGRANIDPEKGWDIDSLIETFDLGEYRSGSVVFTPEHLLHHNHTALQKLSPAEVFSQFQSFITQEVAQMEEQKATSRIPSQPSESASSQTVQTGSLIIGKEKSPPIGEESDIQQNDLPHYSLLAHLPQEKLYEATRFFKGEVFTLKELALRIGELFYPPQLGEIEKSELNNNRELFTILLREIEESKEPLTSTTISDILHRVSQATGLTGARLYRPIRTALTGRDYGPPLIQIINLIGKEEVIRRIKAINFLTC